MRTIAWISVVCALALGIPTPNIFAQEDVHVAPREKPKEPKPEDPTLSTHTKPIVKNIDLVLVPVEVLDPQDRMVVDLKPENFQIFEDDKQQSIKHVSSDDAPISLGIILDVSGSMSDKIDKAKEAVVEFCKIANVDDEFFLISFSDRPELLSDFVTTSDEIQNKLLYASAKGRTSLIDAVYLGLLKMKDAKHDRKALLIVSDGGDNRSRYTESEVRSIAKEADVLIYSVGIFDPDPKTLEERNGPLLLENLANITGGRVLIAQSADRFSEMTEAIGMELRNQYVIAYTPKNQKRDGKWRKIKVKIKSPAGMPFLHVYAKQGYYAPGE